MPPRVRLFHAAMTLALLLIPAVALYSELRKRSDICGGIRAQGLPSLLIYAATIGALLVTFLLLVTDRLAYRGERS